MSIVQNRKAFHDYFIEEKYEAGMALSGWEAKAIRAGRAQIAEAYVVMKDGGLYLIGAHITALPTASTHVQPDPTRTRKLLAPLITSVEAQATAVDRIARRDANRDQDRSPAGRTLHRKLLADPPA